MMTKEEISKAIDECEEMLKKLRDELNKPEYGVKYGGKRWKPKLGEDHFYVNACGLIFTDNWHEDESDEKAYAIGNVFPTREAAEFEAQRRRVIAELSDFAEGDDAVWDMAQCHYSLYYDYTSDHVKWHFNQFVKQGGLYFPSLEAAKAALEAVGGDRVKKYYLGVRE